MGEKDNRFSWTKFDMVGKFFPVLKITKNKSSRFNLGFFCMFVGLSVCFLLKILSGIHIEHYGDCLQCVFWLLQHVQYKTGLRGIRVEIGLLSYFPSLKILNSPGFLFDWNCHIQGYVTYQMKALGKFIFICAKSMFIWPLVGASISDVTWTQQIRQDILSWLKFESTRLSSSIRYDLDYVTNYMWGKIVVFRDQSMKNLI